MSSKELSELKGYTTPLRELVTCVFRPPLQKEEVNTKDACAAAPRAAHKDARTEGRAGQELYL